MSSRITASMSWASLRLGSDWGGILRIFAMPMRVACLVDLDGTVIQPRDGKPFPKDSFDWQFCSPRVVPKLRELHRAGSVDAPFERSRLKEAS